MKHSPSSLKAWKTCPRQYAHLRVWKDVEPDPSGPEAQEGTLFHTMLERYLMGAAMRYELPKHLHATLDRIDALRSAGVAVSEGDLALDRELKPAAWDEAWLRGRADMLVREGAVFRVIDFKTGKRGLYWREYWPQIAYYALWLFRRSPAVEKVVGELWWTKLAHGDEQTWTRDDVPKLAREVVGPARAIERSVETLDWPCRPSGLCKAHCPVPMSKCDYSQREG